MTTKEAGHRADEGVGFEYRSQFIWDKDGWAPAIGAATGMNCGSRDSARPTQTTYEYSTTLAAQSLHPRAEAGMDEPTPGAQGRHTEPRAQWHEHGVTAPGSAPGGAAQAGKLGTQTGAAS